MVRILGNLWIAPLNYLVFTYEIIPWLVIFCPQLFQTCLALRLPLAVPFTFSFLENSPFANQMFSTYAGLMGQADGTYNQHRCLMMITFLCYVLPSIFSLHV